MTARISIIAAIGRNRELGKNDDLIWHIPDDLKRFKKLTTGHPVIMGRKTFDSIVARLGKPLPDRTNIVVTHQDIRYPKCIVAHTFHHALAAAEELDRDEVFIIGGAGVYKTGLLYANRLYLTCIDAEDKDADVFFPPFEDDYTHVIERESGTVGNLHYEWVTLERNSVK
jgi:dihydrofolate reductase